MTKRLRKRAESFKELRALFLRESDPKGRERSIAAYKPQPTDIVITPFGKSGRKIANARLRWPNVEKTT